MCARLRLEGPRKDTVSVSGAVEEPKAPTNEALADLWGVGGSRLGLQPASEMTLVLVLGYVLTLQVSPAAPQPRDVRMVERMGRWGCGRA